MLPEQPILREGCFTLDRVTLANLWQIFSPNYVVFQNSFLESESKETNFNRKEVDVGMVQPSDCIKLRPAPGVMEDEH